MKTAGIFITRKCNMNCAYCNVPNPNKHELTLTGWKKAFKIMQKLGVEKINILGGEPTLYKKFNKTIDFLLNKTDFKISITTNGLNKLDIKKLIGIGLKNIGVSIDNLNLSESISPAKSKKGLEFITFLEKENLLEKINLTVYIVVNKLNINKLTEHIEYFNKKNIAVYLLPFHWDKSKKYIHRKSNEKNAICTKEDVKNYKNELKKVLDLKALGYKIKNSSEFLVESCNYIEKLNRKCVGLTELRVDCDGKLMCCCDKNGNVNDHFTIFDLNNKIKCEKFINMRERDSHDCDGCLWPSVFEAEIYENKNKTYEKEVKHLISQYFKTYKIVKSELGTGQNYIIESENKKYFAKFFSKNLFGQISNEILVVNFLKENAIPVADFVKSKKDNFIELSDNLIITVQEWIDAEQIKSKFHCTKRYAYESVEYLSKINLLLSSFSFKDKHFIDTFENVSTAIKKIENLKNKFNETKCAKYEKIVKILDEKILMLTYLENQNLPDINKFTFVNTHGDFSILQTLRKQKKIERIIDFSNVGCYPAVWDLFRSYTYAFKSCKHFKINGKDLKKYINLYEKNIKLSEYDKKNMIGLYVIKMLKSVYGIEACLHKDFSTFRFGVFRHKLTKKLYKKFIYKKKSGYVF